MEEKSLLEVYESKSALRGFITPLFEEGFTIANIAASILASAECDVSLPPLSNEVLKPEVFNKNKIALIIVDSLRYDYAVKYSSKIPRIEVRPILSTAPSTTVTALTSISYASSPSLHAMLGYKMFLKEYGGVVRILDFTSAAVSQKESLKDSLVDLSKLVDEKTIFEKLSEKNYKTFFLVRKGLCDTSFTRLLSKGATCQEYFTLPQMFVKIAKLLRDHEKVFIYAYYGALDAISHENGPFSEEYRREAENVFYWIKVFIEELAPEKDYTLLITADHGQISISEHHIIDIRALNLYKELKVPPFGESRFTYFIAEKEFLFEGLENIAEVYTIKELAEKKVFGEKFSEKFWERAGTYVALALEDYCLVHPFTKKDLEFKPKGHHGGLSKEEMIVPLMSLVA